MATGSRETVQTLAVCLGILLGAVLLDVSPEEESVAVGDYSLPTLCLHRAFSGHPCPGCGMTRSFVHLGHGQLARAARANPAGPLLFVVIVLQLPFRVWQLHYRRQSQTRPRWLRLMERAGLLLLVITALVAVGNWLLFRL